ncbi:MAG: protein kinase [Ignavibacteria bacterium]|nr:protein kinase [Ignavibacteria bacterium]
MIGQTISHYRILEKLGEGGMGVVYKAQDLKLDRDVALKFLPLHVAASSDDKARFLQEAKAVASLEHPNICTVYEIDEVGGKQFIAMAYVEGQNLHELLKTGPMKIEQAIDLALQVAEGLSAAHKKDIVHRDIKSSNIIVAPDGQATIMDFGLAKRIGMTQLTIAGATVGTVPYMSPEQARGDDVDHRTDIWSFGVMLYEMVAGRLPFRSDYNEALIYSILNEEPPAASSVRADVPMHVEGVVKKAMQKDRALRYQQMDELIGDLRNREVRTTTHAFALSKRVKLISIAAPILFAALVVSYTLLPLKTESRERKSIAVLPLKNLSDSKEDEYFSDGITEDIISQISKIPDMKVISRTSVMHYKGVNKNLKEIGRELGVATILEGSIRREGDQIRIATELIDVTTDEHIWAEMYDREFKQIFAIQSEIAKSIAAHLKATLSQSVREQIEKKPTENLEAYSYLLKGREYYVSRNVEQAMVLFKKALELDSTYAVAYAWLSHCYSQRTTRFGYPALWLDSARYAAEKAISIDRNLAEGYAAFGRLYLSQGSIMKALEATQKSIELNPNLARIYGLSGYGYFFKGRLDQAFPLFGKSVSYAPAEMNPLANKAQAYFALGLYDKCEESFQRALQLQPEFPDAAYGLSLLRLIQGRSEESIALSGRIHDVVPDFVPLLNMMAMAHLFSGHYVDAEPLYQQLATKGSYIPGSFPLGVVSVDYDAALGMIALKTGKKGEAKRLFDRSFEMNRKAIELGNELYHYRYNIAAVLAIQNNSEEAVRWFQKAVDAGWRLYRIAQVDPFFDNLRKDERFRQMMAKVETMVDDQRKLVEQTEKQ